MRVSSKYSLKRVNVMLAALFGIISIIGLIIYSELNTGEFVMSDLPPVDSPLGIMASDNIAFEYATTRLMADALVDKIGIAYQSISIDDILHSEGQYIDPDQKYLAYSFYIKNTGTNTINVEYYMRISEVFGWMDEYVRVLIIEDDTNYRMYKKADQPDQDNNLPNYNHIPVAVDFLSDNFIFRDNFSQFKPDEVKSFRVVIWLEEQDPDIIYSDQVGRFVTQFHFRIVETEQLNSGNIHLLSINEKEIWLPVYSIVNIELSIFNETDDTE